jgi:ribosomal protein L7Ae-like RNA K-turn-binding protein
MKAGKLTSGEANCEAAMQKGEAWLLLVCNDASENTKRKFANKAEFYNVPMRFIEDTGDVNKAIGKTNRMTIIITDRGFYEAIMKVL